MRSAAANVPLQKLFDFGSCWVEIRLQKADAAHNHSGGAVSALEGTGVNKRLLHRMELAVALETLDGRNRLSDSGAHRNLARTTWSARDQDRACSTLAFTATILGAGQSDLVAQYREERSFGVALHRVSFPVDFQFREVRHSFTSAMRSGQGGIGQRFHHISSGLSDAKGIHALPPRGAD